MGVKIKSALGSVTLDAENIASNTTVTVPAAGGTLATAARVNAVGGRKNLIINGAMQVAQRGTSFLNNGTYISNLYGADRFRSSQSGLDDCDVSISNASTNLPEFPQSFKVTVETAESAVDANDRAYIDYIVEAQDLQHLQYGTSSAQDLTLSFWIKSSVTGTYAFFGYQPDVSPARMFNANYTIDSANIWEKKTITIPGDSSGQIDNNNLQGMYLRWFFFAGSNWTGSETLNTWKGATSSEAPNHNAQVLSTSGATFEITGVQLEVGDTATDFEHRSFGEELALCQRYYQKSYTEGVYAGTNTTAGILIINGSTEGGSSSYQYHTYPVPMRAASSITFYNSAGTAGVWQGNSSPSSSATRTVALDYAGTAGFYFHVVLVNTWVVCQVYGHFTADAEL